MKAVVSGWLARCLSGLLWLLARLPAPVNRVLVRAGAFIYVGLARGARQTIITNLRHIEEGLAAQGVVVDSPVDFARRNLAANVQLIPETALCWRGPPNAWRSLISDVHGDEALGLLNSLRDGQAGDTRVLLLSPHLGNWELLNMYLGAEFGLTVLYDPPKLAVLEPLIRNARQLTQSTLLPIGPSGLRAMVRRLREGRVVGLLPDQVPEPESGVLTGFFGKQALTINLVHRLVERHQPRVFMAVSYTHLTLPTKRIV